MGMYVRLSAFYPILYTTCITQFVQEHVYYTQIKHVRLANFSTIIMPNESNKYMMIYDQCVLEHKCIHSPM